MRQFVVLIFVTCLFMVSSCSVYHKKTISLEETVQSEQKVKVVFMGGRKMHFQDIVLEEEVFYGIERVNGQRTKVLIRKGQIKEVHQINEDASAGLSIIVGACVLAAVFIAALAVTF